MTASVMYVVSWLGAIALGAAVLVAERMLPKADPAAASDGLRQGMRLGAWVTMITATVVASVALLGGVIYVVGVVVLLMIFQRSRSTRYQSILWSLTVAAERGLPLVPALDAVAEEQGPLGGWRAHRLARLLEAGWPLPDALEQVRGPIPREMLVAIRVGCEAGAPGEALRQALTALESRSMVWAELGWKTGYLLFLLVWAWGISMFMMLKITPAFAKIFADFGANLPTATQLLIDGASLAANFWFLLAPLHLLLGCLMVYATIRYIGWFDWDVPGLGWFTRRYHTANLLESLAVAVAHGRPLPQALAGLALRYPRWWIRYKLRGALFDLDGGADWCESLCRRGLIGRAEVAVLQAAQRVGNLPWALREMAESNRRRLAYRLRGLLHLLFPVVVLAFALMVAAFVIGYFMPLIALIEKLC
jgi:protein transport protein HofC